MGGETALVELCEIFFPFLGEIDKTNIFPISLPLNHVKNNNNENFNTNHCFSATSKSRVQKKQAELHIKGSRVLIQPSTLSSSAIFSVSLQQLS